MEEQTVSEYHDAITVLEAQECLIQMEISDFPHMKKDKRRTLWRKYQGLADRWDKGNDGVISADEFIRRMREAQGKG